MKYFVTINKRVTYVKVYNVIKRVNTNTNFLSNKLQSLIDKLAKKNKAE
ncbi:MAG: hypothetical protein QW774_03520 [Candidatus Micrarchaeaceae archaeon]